MTLYPYKSIGYISYEVVEGFSLFWDWGARDDLSEFCDDQCVWMIPLWEYFEAASE